MASRQKLPPHGTMARYRLELQTKSQCERCKACAAAAKRKYRKAQRSPRSRAHLRIVDDRHSVQTSVDAPEAPPAPPDPAKKDADTDSDTAPERGPMAQAVELDIVAAASSVPIHHSLEAMARALASEIDNPESKASKATSIKGLYEVMKSLQNQGEGGDEGVDAFLDIFSAPLIPGMPA